MINDTITLKEHEDWGVNCVFIFSLVVVCPMSLRSCTLLTWPGP